jgi:hypothetical protein
VFTTFRDTNNCYHPLVIIVSDCCNSLKNLEYSNSSDPIEETSRYYKVKISIKEFLLIPNDIEKVFSKSGHQAKLRARSIVNDKVINNLQYLEQERKNALMLPYDPDLDE